MARECRGERVWASEGRSAATRRRAASIGLTDVGTVVAMAACADLIISVCPPDQALDVARSLADVNFAGIFVDANAVAPQRSREIAALLDHYVDGGIIGPPADRAGSTRLYLCGADAAVVAARWDGSLLNVRVLDGPIGAASALKMSYAAWTKGTQALLLAVNALAESTGVLDALHAEWELSVQGAVDRSSAATSTAAKAWRFEGEMREIAATFAEAGLPAEFHLGAAEINRRLAAFKDQPAPSLDDVIAALLNPTPT